MEPLCFCSQIANPLGEVRRPELNSYSLAFSVPPSTLFESRLGSGGIVRFGAESERRSAWQGLEVVEDVQVRDSGNRLHTLPEQIEQLELRIEELREAIQRSRKLMLAGRACAIIGPTFLVCLLPGLLGSPRLR